MPQVQKNQNTLVTELIPVVTILVSVHFLLTVAKPVAALRQIQMIFTTARAIIEKDMEAISILTLSLLNLQLISLII